jgi:type VI secretion system protein
MVTLTLSIRNANSLDNGSPTTLTLDRRGGVIGRSPTVDWSLPDPKSHISSRHCEIAFRDGSYIVNDVSTNGTFINGGGARMPGPHILQEGDVIGIGHFEVVALFGEGAGAAIAAARSAAPQPERQWGGWDAQGGGAAPPAPPASMSGWDAPAPGSAISGRGPMSQSWAPPAAAVSPASGASASGGWGPTPPPPPSVWEPPQKADEPASGWSSAAPDRPPPPTTDDVWGKIAEGNVVDWARGGFGQPPPPPKIDPLGLAPAQATFDPMPAPRAVPVEEYPAPQAESVQAPSAPPPPAPVTQTQGPDQTLSLLLTALGLNGSEIKSPGPDTIKQAGSVLHRVVAGLVVMLEARARAKAQMGAQSTSLEFDGNNPLKFARTPEQALAQLLNPAERGFMAPERAIEDAFHDLQSHQMATLKAMQGALRATLDRFSPTSIRSRATAGGFLKKILPGARDAALWQAYEHEFGGVAQGSDEAFMDVFSKEFRKAYEELSAKRFQ